jgi:hypothetical protein
LVARDPIGVGVALSAGCQRRQGRELIACDGGISQPSLAAVEGDNQALARVWRVTREKGGLPQ